MAKVFVSHSSRDSVQACTVRGWLADDGHEVFLDQGVRDGIVVGEEWERRLYERLRWADAVVCVLTSAYVASAWCTAEVGIARARGSRILPVGAESGVRHPLLGTLQQVDLDSDPATARAKLSEALRGVDAIGGLGWPDDRSPYPGLRPFDTDLHRVFFGRGHETEQLAALLRSPAQQAEATVLLVVGPSGCGKSSLVRAGLLPVVAAEPDWWTVPPMIPASDPFAALARELATTARQVGLDWTVTDVRDRLAHRGLAELADDLLLATPGRRRRHLLVVVDQFEELVTLAPPEERAAFARLLRCALPGPARVVATLRPEFLDRLLVDESLSALPTQVYTLRPLHRDAIRSVVVEPAAVAGIAVDDDLVTRLVADTDSGDALPLLAYTLAELARGIGRGGRLLGSRYDELGGVQGALRRQADAALAEAVRDGGRTEEQVIRQLLSLVTVDEQDRPTRRRVAAEELPGSAGIELEPFVRRRLLTSDTEDGRPVLGVAHEAFLSAWPPLARAISGAAGGLRARARVEPAAATWHEDGRPPVQLWERGQLAAAVTDTGARYEAARRTAAGGPAGWRTVRRWLPGQRSLTTDRVDLTATARAFLDASIRRDRIRRRRAVAILSVLLVLALTAAGVAFVQQRIASQRETVATARQLAATAVAELDTDLQLAQLLAAEAHRIFPDPQTQSALFDAVTASPRLVQYLDAGSEVSVLNGAGGGNAAVAGTEDGHLLSWDLSTGASERIRMGDRPVTSVAVNQDGSRVIGADGQTAVVWDVRTGQHSVVATGLARSVGVSPSGQRAAVILGPEPGSDGADEPARLTLLDLEAGQQLNQVPIDHLYEKAGLPDDRTVTLISGGGR
ncbi:nSTAND1 domain-containing NTPase [Geodermatophilus sp. SYSU D01105]